MRCMTKVLAGIKFLWRSGTIDTISSWLAIMPGTISAIILSEHYYSTSSMILVIIMSTMQANLIFDIHLRQLSTLLRMAVLSWPDDLQ